MQDIQDLSEGLRRSPAILSSFVGSIAESKMDLRRGEGFWTIAEHVGHLARVQPMILNRRSEELWLTKDAYLTRLQ